MTPYDPRKQLGSEPDEMMNEGFGAFAWMAIVCAVIGLLCGLGSLA